MYFYVYDGQVYWGRHQSIPPHRHVTTWVFRNKPVKMNHLYISGSYSFQMVPYRIASKNNTFTVLVRNPDVYDDDHYHPLFLEEGRCLFLSRDGFRYAGSTEKHDKAREQFKNTFKNRLKEYAGRYFLPIDKHFRSI